MIHQVQPGDTILLGVEQIDRATATEQRERLEAALFDKTGIALTVLLVSPSPGLFAVLRGSER